MAAKEKRHERVPLQEMLISLSLHTRFPFIRGPATLQIWTIIIYTIKSLRKFSLKGWITGLEYSLHGTNVTYKILKTSTNRVRRPLLMKGFSDGFVQT